MIWLYFFAVSLNVWAASLEDRTEDRFTKDMQPTYDWKRLEEVPYGYFDYILEDCIGSLSENYELYQRQQLNSFISKWIEDFATPYPALEEVKFNDQLWPYMALDLTRTLNKLYSIMVPSNERSIILLSKITNAFYGLNFLYLKRKEAGDLEKGYTGFLECSHPMRDNYQQYMHFNDFAKYSNIFVFFYAQGSFQRTSPYDCSEVRMPRLLMGFVPTKELPNATSKVYCPCEYDAFRESGNPPFVSKLGAGFVATQKGIETDHQLVLQVGEDCIDLICLNGKENDIPFGVSQKIHLEKSNPTTATAYESVMNLFKIGPNYADKTICMTMPETDTDMDVLELLLAKTELIESTVNPQLKENNVEEIGSDNDTSGEQEPATSSPPKISSSTKKAIRKLEQKKLEEQRQNETKQRIRDAEEAAIQKLMNKIDLKEKYEAQVRYEQEETSRRVAAAAQAAPSGKNKKVKSSFVQAQQLEKPKEDESAKQARLRTLAVAQLNAKKVSMREMVSVLNQIFKIIPGARQALLPTTRQSGSHLVMNAASAQSGPATLVIPHAGNDKTVYAHSAQNFMNLFIQHLTKNAIPRLLQ